MPTLDPYVKSKQKRQPKPQYARGCPECGTAFVTSIVNKMCCQRACTEAQWRRNRPERLITAAEVRREDHMDRPKLAHVCHYYPPAFRCLCGKRAAVLALAGNGD